MNSMDKTVEAYKFFKSFNKKEEGVGTMMIVMRKGNKTLSTMSFTNEEHARYTFNEMIKENKELGYAVINRGPSCVELAKNNCVLRMIEPRLFIEIVK